MDYMIEVNGKQMLVESVIEGEAKVLNEDMVDQLIALRKAAGMTQQDVADRIGLPRANVSRLERKLHAPTLEILMKYAASLGKTIRWDLEDR